MACCTCCSLCKYSQHILILSLDLATFHDQITHLLWVIQGLLKDSVFVAVIDGATSFKPDDTIWGLEG